MGKSFFPYEQTRNHPGTDKNVLPQSERGSPDNVVESTKASNRAEEGQMYTEKTRTDHKAITNTNIAKAKLASIQEYTDMNFEDHLAIWCSSQNQGTEYA